MASITFWKYHGLGNDFVVVENMTASADLARRLCDRHFGVGADGVLFLEDTPMGTRLIIVNQDGSRPQMCGNGIRCVARHLVETRNAEDTVAILTDAGWRQCAVNRQNWEVRVDMGPARRDPDVEFVGLPWHQINMGNPHAVTFVDTFESLDAIDRMGRLANADRAVFPEGVNLEFCRIGDAGVDVIVYERGVGRTLACGTGACAAAIAAADRGLIGLPASVRLPGGQLWIEEKDGTTWMTGSATLVYQGSLAPEWASHA